MTNMGRLLMLLRDTNCYVQDISTNIKDSDKVFSISRKKITKPFNVDFEVLEANGFKAIKMGQFEKCKDELIVKYVKE